jgi:hypothetical protein
MSHLFAGKSLALSTALLCAVISAIEYTNPKATPWCWPSKRSKTRSPRWPS